MTKVGPFCAHNGPLEELLVHVHCDDEVPDAWIAKHAPDGSLATLWATCNHVRVLIDLAVLTADHLAVVRAACACARLVVKHLPAERRATSDAALETAERWTFGKADVEALGDAARATEHPYSNEPIDPLVSTAASAVEAAVATAAIAAGRGTRWYDTRQGAEAANHAAISAAAAMRWADPNRSNESETPEETEPAEVCPPLAAVLRAHLPCPSLADVRRGLERLRES